VQWTIRLDDCLGVSVVVWVRDVVRDVRFESCNLPLPQLEGVSGLRVVDLVP